MTSERQRPRLHGILVIDKPASWTSHDVVGWIRRWSHERKVGHAGTLDPAATGVLPVALNDGTRVLEFLADAHKAYVAEITFGVTTDSADIDGVVIRLAEPVFSDEDLHRALGQFRGRIRQRPPLHSAIKVAGKRAYELARVGATTSLPEREIDIFALDVLEWKRPVLTSYIECSKGTYIRSIARDLGERLGCGAYLSNLVRTQSGPFCLADAWSISALSEISPTDEWPTVALHPDHGVADWPAIVVNERDATNWRFGRPVPALPGADARDRGRIYDSAGAWLGLATISADRAYWKPLRVIGTEG